MRRRKPDPISNREKVLAIRTAYALEINRLESVVRRYTLKLRATKARRDYLLALLKGRRR